MVQVTPRGFSNLTNKILVFVYEIVFQKDIELSFSFDKNFYLDMRYQEPG
jgi:hypothetical protein